MAEARAGPGRVCTFGTCGRPHEAKGLCSAHYQQKRSGRDLIPATSMTGWMSLAERLDHNTLILLDGHEIWDGNSVGGYGRLSVNSRLVMAHRAKWELYRGPIPEGMVLDHTCNAGHLGCVTLDHLKVVTPWQNNSRKARRKSNTGHDNICETKRGYFLVSVRHKGIRCSAECPTLDKALQVRAEIYTLIRIKKEGEHFVEY